jgi:hypothetical protein
VLTEDICPGGSVTINGIEYSTAGAYLDTIAGGSMSGCDSILDITINLLPDFTTVLEEDICPGESVSINGMDYSTPGYLSGRLGNG